MTQVFEQTGKQWKPQFKLLLKEQSIMVYTPFHLYLFEALLCGKTLLFKILA